MGAWGRFTKWLMAADPPPEEKAYFSRFESLSGPFPEPVITVDTNSYSETVTNVTERHYLVYAAQKKLAESLARLPFKVYKLDSAGDRVEAPRSDRWRRLFTHPNGYQDGFEFFEGTVYSLLNGGEFFWEVTPASDELHLLRPDFMTEKVSPQKGLVGWQFMVNDQTVDYSADEIVHGMFFNPLNRWRGLSPLAALRLQIESDLEAQAYNRNFYRNSAIASGVLQTTEFLEDSDYERIRGQWEKAHKGSSKASRVGILEMGLEWKPTTIPQKDAEFVEQMKLSREAILTVFQVPPAILGLYEYANYANSESQRAIFYQEGVGPLARRIERAAAAILPEGYMAEFLFHEVLRPEFRERQEGYTAAINTGYMSRNEVRRLENLPPMEGGDTLFVPVNTMPLERILAAPGPAEGGNQDARDIVAGKKHREIKTLDRGSVEYERIVHKLQRALEKAFEVEGAQVLRRISDMQGLSDVLEGILGPEDADLIKAAAEPGMREAILYGARAGEAVLLEVGFATVEPNLRALEILPTMLDKFAADVSKTTVGAIRDEIRIGMANGEDIGQISRRVRQYYDEAGQWRAEIAARTETARAYCEGRLDTYRLNGVAMKEWVTVGDDRVSDTCAACEGEGQIPIDALFLGEFDGPPGHANCRCDVFPVV